MFALSAESLIEAINSKTPESIPVPALLYSLVPNVSFGYPENSSGEFNTKEEYESLIWSDNRPQPTWEDLEQYRSKLFIIEQALDLNNLRELRYNEFTLDFQNNEYKVNPSSVSLLESQIKLAETVGDTEVNYLTARYVTVKLSLDDALSLLLKLRKQLNQWVIDPRVP